MQRNATTDQLAKIIQVIQLGHKSGTLSVERGIDQAGEEGVIIFMNGQVIEAKAGQLRGQAAFQWLSTWQACRFAFLPASQEAHNPGPPAKNWPVIRAFPSSPASLPAPEHPPQAVVPSSASSVPCWTQPPGQALQLIERAGLSRVHRHLFLLIDGQRTENELTRLTGRKPREVSKFLKDLEVIGVIRLSL